MSKKILLVGVDGSEAGKKALDFAINMAQEIDARIELLHIIDWSPYQFQTLEENAERSRTVRQQLQDDRQNLFPPLEAAARAMDIPVSSKTVFGDPADELVEGAKKLEAFAIVVGRRGMSRLKRTIVGSVARAIIHDSSVPVMVVPFNT